MLRSASYRSNRASPMQLLHQWLDSWSGIGHVAIGMTRQGYDLELRRYDGQGWRATFYPEGFEHSRTAYSGSALAPTPYGRRHSGRQPRRSIGERPMSPCRVTGR
jgi:hypothetical protein